MSEAPQSVRKPENPLNPSAGRFVPSGVDAQSWIGFEHRIQERRFRALLETIAAATARGDAVSARIALEEARELRPDASELAEAESRVALLPAAIAAASPGFFQSRTFNAIALLTVGVMLLTGLDAIRSTDVAVSDEQTASAPLLAPALNLEAVDTDSAPVFEPEPPPPPPVEDSEPVTVQVAAVTPAPDPIDTTIGTAGTADRVASTPPARDPEPSRPEVRPALLVEPAAAPLPRTEIPDDVVVLPAPQPRREAIVASPVLSRASRGPLLVPPVVTADGTASNDASVARSAAAVVRDETLVSSVLDRYVRAYDALDASAAREVWPTVDERALARAFAGLESQHLTFDDCTIDVRGEVANASCRGLASYVGKVGSRQPRTEPRRWTFELRREGEAWRIETAQTATLQ